MDLSNKRFYKKNVLITGGAGGIGFEIARQFANEGAVISIFDNNSENLKRAKEQLLKLADVVNIFVVDVSNQQQVIAAVQNAEDNGPIDVLVNNAGIAIETSFLNITAEEWRKIIDINFTGMFFVAQAVCRKMALRKKGCCRKYGK